MTRKHIVTDEWNGSRVDRFIRVQYPRMPFSGAQVLLRKGKIRVNGRKAAGGTRLEHGDAVEVLIDEAEAVAFERAERRKAERKPADDTARRLEQLHSQWGSIGKEISVLYEDEAVLVIDKPPGIVVHPGNRKEMGSLLDLLEEYRAGARGEDPSVSFPYTPVHRLDSQTSGALVIAKTRNAARNLSRAIARGPAEKVYLAVVEGVPAPQADEISKPIRVVKGRRSVATTDDAGKPAATSYRLVRILPGANALLEVRITTGRTHQIRVHLASIGHPVAGDHTYGSMQEGIPRLMLHAWKIRFPHPASGSMMEIAAPPPEDIG